MVGGGCDEDATNALVQEARRSIDPSAAKLSQAGLWHAVVQTLWDTGRLEGTFLEECQRAAKESFPRWHQSWLGQTWLTKECFPRWTNLLEQ